jgi:hypothetical protein
MNKSAVGMILLVVMVITKAVITIDQRNREIVAKSEFVSLVGFSERTFDLIAPKAGFLALSSGVHDYSSIIPPVSSSNFSDDLPTINKEPAVVNERHESAEEIKPLEAFSNTGYGRWMGENENSFKVDDSAPLDNENTISENMSRLFPRNQ